MHAYIPCLKCKCNKSWYYNILCENQQFKWFIDPSFILIIKNVSSCSINLSEVGSGKKSFSCQHSSIGFRRVRTLFLAQSSIDLKISTFLCDTNSFLALKIIIIIINCN